ncbi:cytochrome P450 [Nonomuraea sp. NPDC050556]|uniref:cytochrome P450 n=1 Tax=Nonomuraea sp. NPDC050556 TaxID=3364369 RepID=UPI0037A8EB71
MFDYNPFDHATQRDPYPVYRRLLADFPVYVHPGQGFHALSRHADVEAALRDAATFSSAYGVTLELWMPEAHRVMGFLAMDRPEHTRFRHLVVQAFTARRVARQEDDIRALTRRLLADPLDTRTFDIAAWMAQIPSYVVSEMIGVPDADRARVAAWTHMLVDRPDEDGSAPDAFFQAHAGLRAYMLELCAERRRAPRDDMLSALTQAEDGADRLTDSEIVQVLGLILAAGHETTIKVLAHAWLQAALHPVQRAIVWAGEIDGWREEM